MEFAQAIIALVAAVISLIIAVINLWIFTRSRLRPTSHNEPEPKQTASSQAAKRSIISWVARWIIGGSVVATAFFSGVTAMGLFLGVSFLAQALEAEPPDVEILYPSQGSIVLREISVQGQARQM